MKYYIINIGFIFIFLSILSCSNLTKNTDSNENVYIFLDDFMQNMIVANNYQKLNFYSFYETEIGNKEIMKVLNNDAILEILPKKTVNYFKEKLNSDHEKEITKEKILSDYIEFVNDKKNIKDHLIYLTYPILSENNEYCIIYMNTDYKDHQVDNVFIFNIVSHDWELLFFRDKEGTF